MPHPRHLLAAVLLTLAACASAPRAGVPPAAPAATHDAAVYAAVIDRFVPAGKTALVIDSTAATRGLAGSEVERRAGAELASSFAEANRAARLLPRPLPSSRAVRFTRHSELPFFAPVRPDEDLEARWRQFHAQFPGTAGFYQFSAIGFDAARSTAVLYSSHSCGSLCGSGSLVTLRRTGSRWEVVNAEILWVS